MSDETNGASTAANAAPADAASNQEAVDNGTPGVAETGALAEVQKQLEAFRDGWQRERAEFANFKKRTEREKLDLYQTATSDVLKSLLPILDDFERAFGSIPDDLKGQPWVDGVGGIQRKMLKLLETFNITPIDPTGEVFNPEQHEAIGTEPSDLPAGTVTITMQRGYRVGERILRPALVRVAQ